LSPYKKAQNIANELTWILFYVGISLLITIALPFPASFLLLIVILLGIEVLRSRSLVKNIAKFKELLQSLSSSQMGNGLVRYYCMSCGYEHHEISCPECGSKMKKVG